MGIWDKFYEKAKSFFTGEEGEGTSENSEPKKRCYYDLLEVERDAAEDDIKKAFKKLALRWHPDKNPGKEKECAAYFVLIQQAYEVLSDPQERAFYDRHREHIIYQNTDGPDERKDTGIQLEPFMSTSCWKGLFTSEEERLEKFYSVYRDLFHQLAAEDYEYIEDPEERNYPVFGTFTSEYESVVAPFYAFWLNFSTQRSFAWLDKWDLRDAPDRYSSRIMEKENRKMREQGKKHRSEDIRRLVEFVRKHDKRVELARQRQKERNEAIQHKVEEQRRQTIRRNLEKLENFEVDEEAQKEHLMDLEQIEQMLDNQFGTVQSRRGRETELDGSDAEVGEEEEEDFQCIVCEKSFKSKKMLDNHLQSKKHKQVVELLKKHMREEDQQFFEEGSSQQENEGDDVKPQRSGKGKRKKKNKKPPKEEESTQPAEDQDPTTPQQSQTEGEEQQQQAKPEEPTEANNDGKVPAANKKGHNKRKGTAAERKNNEQKQQQQKPAGPVPSQCLNCGEEFESKSKLHDHLKESGHAVLKTTTSTTVPAKKSGDAQKKAHGKKNKE